MANPKPVHIEGKPLSVIANERSVDLVMQDDVTITLQSANAILIENLTKLTKVKHNLRITFEVAQ